MVRYRDGRIGQGAGFRDREERNTGGDDMGIKFEETVEAEAIRSDNDKPAEPTRALAVIELSTIIIPAARSSHD